MTNLNIKTSISYYQSSIFTNYLLFYIQYQQITIIDSLKKKNVFHNIGTSWLYKAKHFRFVFRISCNHLHKLFLKCFLLYRTFEVDWHMRDAWSTYYNSNSTKTRRLTAGIHYNDNKNYT